MKVAHILRRFTFEEWGGTETVVWNLVQRQRDSGVDVEILCTSALSVPGEEIRDGIRIRRFGYWYPYFPMSSKCKLELDKKGGNPFVPKLFKALEHGGFDVIHIHSGGRIAVQCTLLAHRLGIPCLISLHGGFADVPKEEVKKMMAPVKGRFHYGGILDRIFGLRRNAVENSDAVLCISRSEEKILTERFPGHRICYLPNGVDCAAFQKKPDCSPRVEWGIPKERRLILCISRIDYQKNQKVLLELLARHNDAHLLLIGPITSEWYHQEIVGRAAELGVSQRLTIIPGLPPNDMRLKAILHEADVFILPSIHEPFGIVVLEAWASGLPVIASNAGGIKDFVVNEYNGLLFEPQDVEALDRAYKLLADKPDVCAKLVSNALENVRNYSWESITGNLMDIYRSMVTEVSCDGGKS